MSTYKARKNALLRQGISPAKLLSTSALTAAGIVALAAPAMAGDGPVGDYDVWEFQNTAAAERSEGYVRYEGKRIVDNLTQEDIGRMGHVDLRANLTVATGIESGPMQILGKLTSTGKVYVLDVDGILHGENSIVDTAGYTAIGGHYTDLQIDGDDVHMEAVLSDDARIEIAKGAQINVSDAGLAAFVAPTVVNAGVISAKMGTVAFEAGKQVTLDLYGDGLVEIAVEGELADAYLENTGRIEAEGGRVQMNALAAKEAVDNIINVDGVVTVASAEVKGGQIVLNGGDKGKVSVSGTLDATGTSGGDVEVTGEYVSAEDGAVIDASGDNGGGTIHFGGEYQGGGDTPTARYAYVDKNAILRANANDVGDGGNVVVWSDKATGVYGSIEAKGGDNGGDGGFVEVSSLGYYDFRGAVNTTAVNGEAGMLLLDPRDVEIRGGTGDSGDGDVSNTSLGSGTGLIDAANDYDNSTPFVIYESEIEGQSATTNIDIQARRNITTVAGGDDTITLAADRDLSISTTNEPQGGEADNDGVIDLSNLGFETSGTGSINVTGSTGSGVSNIILGNLTAVDGNINVTTDNGNINVGTDGTDAVSGGMGGGSNGTDGQDAVIRTTTGDINLTANGTIKLGGDGGNDAGGKSGGDGGKGVLVTTSGSINLTADDLEVGGDAGSGSKGGAGGLGLINATDSAVRIGRYSAGDISLGEDHGGLHIDQDEIYLIFADELTIGNDNTTNIMVDNVDLFAQLIISTDDDTLPPTSQGCENSSGGNPHCGMEENTVLTDTNLTLDANDEVFILDGDLTMGTGTVTVDAPELSLDGRVYGKDTLDGVPFLLGETRLIGAEQLHTINVVDSDALIQQAMDFADSSVREVINVGADTYDESVVVNKTLEFRGANYGTAGYDMRGPESIVTGGSPAFTVNADNVIIDGFTMDGGMMGSLTYGVLLNDVKGTEIRNNIISNSSEAGIGGSVDHDAAGGTLVVEDNLIDDTNTGDGIRIIGDPTASNLIVGADIDITDNQIGTDGMGGGNGVGGKGIVFVDSLGDHDNVISLANEGSDINISDNIVHADNTAVEFNGVHGSDVVLAGNDITSDTFVGVLFAAGSPSVSGASDVQIRGNTIMADDDGIRFADAISGSVVQLGGNTITGGVDGVDFSGAVSGSTVTMGDWVDPGFTDQSITGAANGVIFRDGVVNSNVMIASDITGNGGDGIRVNGDIDNSRFTVGLAEIRYSLIGGVGVNTGASVTGSNSGIVFGGDVKNGSLVEIVSSTVTGQNGDGVRFEKEVNGSEAHISGNTIEGQDGDGVLFDGHVTNGATVKIDDDISAPTPILGAFYAGGVGNTITGSDDGIEFDGIQGASTVNIAYNTITGTNGDGVVFDAGSPSISGGSVVDVNHNTINAGGDGIYVDDDITDAGTRLEVGDNDITAGDDGVDIDHVLNSAYVSIGGVIDHDSLTPSDNKGNRISASGNAIEFDSGVDATVLIRGNRLDAGEDGINIRDEDAGHVTGVDSGAHVEITNNDIGSEGSDTIGDDGIDFDQSITGSSTVLISGNHIGRSGANVGDDGIDIDSISGGATVTIEDNPYIHASSNGVELSGGMNSGSLTIQRNSDVYGGVDGIHIEGGFSNAAVIAIDDNTIDSGVGDGIEVNQNVGGPGGVDLDITDNHVHHTGDNGIEIHNVDGTFIDHNTVHDSGANGIYVDPSDNVEISNNRVHDSVLDGIHLEDGSYGNIHDNHVGRSGGDGIDVENNYGVDITDNYVHNSGDSGIEVSNSYNADVLRNTIRNSGGDGIDLSGSNRADIRNNTVRYSGDDGIDVDNSARVDVNDNHVHGATHNGIEVTDSYNADIISNRVHYTGDDGIFADNINRGDVRRNTVHHTGDDGIDVRGSDFIDIVGNNIRRTRGDGIQVRDSSFADVNDNRIRRAGDDGIDFENGLFSTIRGNNIRFVDHNGIEVEDSAFINIAENDVGYAENGIFVDPSFFINVEGNNVHHNFIGIHFDQVGFGRIADNNVHDNYIGIGLEDAHIIDVSGNTIADNAFGLWAYGGDNGYIRVRNNVFMDNPVHATFNSGIIDLTGETSGNEFYGGDIALYFDVWNKKDPTSLSLVREGGIFAGGYTYDGNGYDTFNGVSVFPPTNFGGTIGYQHFEGQSESFVALGDETFVDPRSRQAIWLDGQNSTYYNPGTGEFINPASQGGILTQAQYDFLESMFYHYPDANNRGIFFFGAPVDNAGLENIEDFFNQFDGFGPGGPGLNVIVTGLPSIGPGLGGGGLSPQALANIAPAAGGEDGEVTPEDLANIAPEAGGEEDGCWNDVVNTAGGGAVASLNWGGTFEDSIAAASGCGAPGTL